MNSYSHGFTLIELLVTMAVAITLMAVGIPLYRSFTANNLAIAETNSLVSALNLARDAAVRRGANVTACPVNNPNAASPQCTGNTTWNGGWLVFQDGGAQGTVDGLDQLIHVWKAFSPAPDITTNVAYITYDSTGAAQAYAAGSTVASPYWKVCQANSKGIKPSFVNVTPAGSIYSSVTPTTTSVTATCP